MESDPAAVVRTASALINEETEVAESFLMAAVYTLAIRKGESPRNIVEALFKALPSSDSWPRLRDSLVEIMEEEEAGDPP